jgi:hypothetical protein
MITQRKIKANRLNARASTGPKTKLGKSHAIKNAYRHGLSISIFGDANRSAEIENLAFQIAGEQAEHHIVELAREIASAQIDLARIRRARHDLFSKKINDPEFRPKTFFKRTQYTVFRELCRLLRVPGSNTVVPEPLARIANRMLYWKPQGAEKFAWVLSDLSDQLIAIDRYERRALSRRKFAVRAFDLARRQVAIPAQTSA